MSPHLKTGTGSAALKACVVYVPSPLLGVLVCFATIKDSHRVSGQNITENIHSFHAVNCECCEVEYA